MRIWIAFTLLCLMVVSAGCSRSKKHKQEPTTRIAVGQQNTTVAVASPGSSKDPNPAPGPTIIYLDIYQLALPFGTLSQSEQFWKGVDETSCVDVATYDLLFKNGMRVGRASIDEWPQLRAMMEQHPARTRKHSFTGTEAKSTELEFKKGIDEQTIFYFDGQNNPIGRTFENCENFMSLSFQPAPRRAPGTVRVALCPVVRSLRTKIQFNWLNEEREVQFVKPERLYDCNLRADIPLGSFLVVAPSREARWPTSIGKSFLITDGEAERLENVLLIVPRPHRTVDETKLMAKAAPTTREAEQVSPSIAPLAAPRGRKR